MKLNNKSISNYVMYKLSKIDNDFSFEELNKVDELVINLKDIINDEEDFNFDDIRKFNNLKRLTLRFFEINLKTILILNIINKLQDITFDNCKINNLNKLKELKSLSLINCNVNVNVIENMKSLEYLTIINDRINLNILNNLNNLKYLNLSYCKVKGELYNINIETLCIDNTNIENYNFIKKLVKLKNVYIDVYQFETYKKYFINLNIKVVNRGVDNE